MAELSTPPPIGIDLGTTHSRIGVWRNEWVEIIPNQQGIKTTPSCVAFTDARRYIGEAAEDQATTNPCNTIFDMKRLIGKRFSSSNVQNDMELLPFRVIIGPSDRLIICVQYQGEEKQFSAMEISSMVLRKLRDIAEAFLGCPIKHAVIAVPACFNNSQRLATVQAGNIAGLNVMRIINEPTAAAIAYGLDNIETNYDGKKKKKKNNILIFDLGGGTLDVSIVTMERENYKVKATVGDPHLGGVDFDNQLIKHLIEEIKKELEEMGLNFELNPKALGKLRTSCERTKRILSSVLETHIEIDSLLPDFDFYSCITRARFEELNKDLFERCIDIVEKCLKDAKMYRSSIHDVVVIGGSTRIPKVQEMLREFFNGKELSMRINSDEAVACGAAIQATILSGLNDKVPDLVVQDIITHSLGIDIATHVFMIPRNTPIPTTEEVILSADQIELPIKVYEGEMTKIQNNDLLGELTLNNAIYFAPYGLIGRIVVCFNVDENGIFTTSVVDKMIGKREIHMIQITSDFMSRMSRTEIEKMAADAEKLKSEEDKYKRKLETKNALETWLNYLSKSIMNDKMLKLAPACKKKINDVLGKTMQWLEKNPQAVGDEFDEQYREYMNCLEKTLAQAGILNFQRSPPPGVGTMTNSKTNYDTQLRQGHTTNTAGTRIYTKSEASNTTRHAMMPIFRYPGFIGDKFCSSGKQGVKPSRAEL